MTITPRGRPAIPKNELRKKVLSVSFEIVKEKGISSLSIEEISRQAAVAKKTIYKHFKNKDAIVEEMISEWTSTREISSPPLPASAEDVLNFLKVFFIELSERVLSQHSVAIFKFLQSDTKLKKDHLETYRKNGIDNASSVLNSWFSVVRAAGFLNPAWPENSAEYLQSLIISPLLRDISLGVLPPVPDLNPSAKIEKILNDFAPFITSSRT